MSLARGDRIFRWHAVIDVPECAFRAFTTSKQDFLDELEAIEAHYDVVPLRDLVVDRGNARESENPRAALTFDDALDCQARFAFPVLESKRLPYTVCIPVESVLTERPLWNTLLRLCILNTSAPSLDLGWISFSLSRDVDRASVAGEIQDLLLCMSEPRWRQATGALYRQCEDVLETCAANASIGPMSWAQIAGLDPELFEPASHSLLHRPAVEADAPEALLEDAIASRAEIERRLHRSCVTYCFPFGIYTAASVDAARRAGYETLLTSCAVPLGTMRAGLVGRFEGSAARLLSRG